MELSRSFDRYFVIARNNKISLRVSTRNKITVILLPSANKRCLEFLVTSFVIVLLAPVLGVSVIVSQCPINGGIAALACKWFYKIRVIHELHGMFYFSFMKDKKSMRGRLIKWSLRHASRIKSLNSAMSNELMALCGPIKIHEVNNRVDFKVFSCPKTDYCLSGSRLRLVSAGRLVWEKNYINLINNLKSYSADNWDLTIIGEGPMRSEIEEFILNNNLTKKVKLLGSRGQREMASLQVPIFTYNIQFQRQSLEQF